MINNEEVYPYLIKSLNKISDGTLNTNRLNVFLQKPPCNTNIFLLEFGGIYIRRFGIPSGSTYRYIEIRLDLPNVIGYDSFTTGKTNVIGYGTLKPSSTDYVYQTYLPSIFKKLVSFSDSGIFELSLANGQGQSGLQQDNGTDVLKNYIIHFHLKPVYPRVNKPIGFNLHEGIPIPIILKSQNKISGSANNFSIFIEKPNVKTNKFILDYYGFLCTRLSIADDNVEIIYEVKLNLPSISTIEGNSQCNDTIGFIQYDKTNITQINLNKTTRKYVNFQSSGVYNISVYDLNGDLISTPTYSICVFSLIPVYD